MATTQTTFQSPTFYPIPSLITLNLDVQNYIISFLSTPDLATLMQTCRHFLDACLLPLCAYSGVVLLEDDFERVSSFRRFLRINAGPSSRAHLIKELWVAIGELDPTSPYDPSAILRLSEEWTPALLDILRHCHNVQRLRLDRWFMKELPYPILMDTIASSMAHLEELTIRAPFGADIDVLCPLARLPLLRLSFLRDPYSSDPRDSPPPTPFSLEGLPRSLTELDTDFHAPINTPFPLVRKLGVRTSGRPIWGAFVANATTAFPDVTQLVVRQHASAGVWSLVPHLVEDTRRLSTIQWRALQARGAWPSLSAIWAEDLCVLYSLGFPNRVHSLSIPLQTRDGEERYTTAVLSDGAPEVLELRVDIDDGSVYSTDWVAHFGSSVASVVRLTMLHYTGRDHSVKMWNGGLERAKLEDLCKMLPAFTSLEYLQIKFKERYSPLDALMVPLDGRDIRYIRDFMRKGYIDPVVRASPTLRWVALEVYGLVEDNVATRGEDQGTAFKFDFKFSMPIQDTFTLTRDPNRFPAIEHISHWSAALLDILRHCRNMRRLRMYKWFLHDIPFAFFVKTISSSLPHLEELTMPVPYDTDATVLRRLARLPLRSFSFLKYPPNQNLPETYISLDVLPRSLTELDIHRSPRTDTPFLGVQKLGIRDTALRTFVANATAAFPNVSYLVLRSQEMGFIRDISYNAALIDDAREHNLTQWHRPQHRDAWPSVSEIWAEDPSLLYILGFSPGSRRVVSVSLPMGDFVSEEYIAPALADTSPSFLELRIDLDYFGCKTQTQDWTHVFRGTSIRRLTLLLHMRAPADERGEVSYVLRCFGAMMLPALPSLTHLLVRLAPTPQRPGSALDGKCWVYSSASDAETDTQIVHATVREYLRVFAGIGASLCWIGYESWDVSRPGGSGNGSGEPEGDPAPRVKGVELKMTEMGESESMALVKREGMDMFKDVRPTLVLMY
ncbi:hypothetical protein V8D89_002542 [Ganoderma adspersum]